MMQAAVALSEQQITSVPVAIEWLRQVSHRDFDEEIEYLKRLKDSTEVLDVYRQIFPGQYSVSEAPLFEPDREWPGYTAREGEFLRLLDRQDWLPIHLADEWEWLAERHCGIPVTPLQGYQWCCGDFDAEELPDGYYLGFCVLTNQWEGAAERYKLTKEDLDFGKGIDYKLFDERLSKEADALKFLPVTTDMMNYATGNCFLDASYCNAPDYYPWTVKNIRRLTREYRRAKLIMNGLWKLDDLVEANPVAVYRRVRDIWNQSLNNTTNDDEPVQD